MPDGQGYHKKRIAKRDAARAAGGGHKGAPVGREMTLRNGLTRTETKELFLIMLDAHQGNITAACKSCVILPKTYYTWVKNDPEFFLKCALVKEGLIDYVESKLLNVIEREDIVAIKYFLSTQAKHRGYTTDSKVQVVGPGGGNLEVDVHHYPPEPKSIAEWEEQVAEAKRVRVEEAKQVNPELLEEGERDEEED